MKTIVGCMFLEVFLCLLLVDNANALVHRMKVSAGNTRDLQKMSGARGQRRLTNSPGLRPNRSRQYLKESDNGGNKMKKTVPKTSPKSSPDDTSITSTPRPTPRPTEDRFSWFPPTLVPVTPPPMDGSEGGEQPPLPSLSPNESTTIPPQTNTPDTMAPALAPTLVVSSSPTVSPSTSTETQAIDKSTFANPQTGALDTSLTCREPIPDDAFGETDQLITYEYILNVMPGTTVPVILAEIEQLIQDELAKDFLNCSFTTSPLEEGGGGAPSFLVHELHTAPTDQLTGGCFDEERLYDADCYQITGYMRAIIFYLPTSSSTTSASAIQRNSNNHDPRIGQHRPGGERRRRLLASEIEDPQVMTAFEAWFQDFFASDTILNVNSRVAGSNFAGITNEYQPPPPEPEDRTGIIVGSVLAGCVGVIIVAAALNYGIKKHQQKAEKNLYKEAMDYVDNELDSDDDNVEFEARSTASQRRREVVVVGEDETVLSGFPVLVDDGARDAEDIRRDLSNMEIMNGYSTSMDGTRFVSSAQTPEHLQPAVFNDQQQAYMLEATRNDLGPRRSEKAKSPRSYGMKNTVEL